jgi:hypothetical protein
MTLSRRILHARRAPPHHPTEELKGNIAPDSRLPALPPRPPARGPVRLKADTAYLTHSVMVDSVPL